MSARFDFLQRSSRSRALCFCNVNSERGREGTYSQMEAINRRVGLPLFQIPQGDDVEEGMVVNPFLG